MSSRTWSEAQIRELLAREDFRYQSIELPFGLSTPGRDRTPTANAIFPVDLTGKDVLDVGCRFGYFCFEARRRGARRVVGVDFDLDAVRKARLLAEIKGMDVEFQTADVESDSLPGDFDIVLGLNILHHMRNPVAVLDKLIRHARERVVLEVASFSRKDAKKMVGSGFLSHLMHPIPLLPPLLERLPVIVLGGDRRHIEETFFISAPAVERLLLTQRGYFSSVRRLGAFHKGRSLIVADKLRIEDLIVIAGPSCSGKSALISNLRAGERPALASALGLGSDRDWTVGYPNHLDELAPSPIRRLVYHYDSLRPFLRGPYEHRRDRRLDIFEVAERIKSVTLWVAPERLAARQRERKIDPKVRLGRYWGSKRDMRIWKAYQDPETIRYLYAKWFDHLAVLPGEHFVLDPEKGDVLVPLEEWRSSPAQVR